ncbi:membrane protein YqaA with SNARE-associated domain [Azospirillum lipoferum]|uniref:DedA family protein n=1 Tax=Azospirillum lipoferum TaxID=193 RepID=A0A5A9GC39_AZOLI|nr:MULTISPECIES: YqaA family protein [Azospirillum]KAA0591931.1 DedA family protein [Azospirillum lipoferum]MCP1614732.1 membrane protein YqaA with SNARE-associated domain [Azospirillum lipoferum]MDW5537432.1 YqaA family protein [Azospirillum sp. NL1]
MADVAAYGSLFLVALVAATIFPAQSELLLAGLHASGNYHDGLLILVATVGNVAGSTINWALGRYLMHFQDRRWFPVSRPLVERATGWYQRFGVWSLLMAWVPVIGDPLTLVAGILRVDLRLFLLLVTIGKLGRYVVLIVAF